MDRCTSGQEDPSEQKKEGQTGKEESIFGPDRSKKGPTQRTKGAKTEIGYGRQSGEVIQGVRPRKKEEGEEGGLCLTPCSVFKMVAFICSESVIPAIPDSKRDRVHCFIHCSQATYFSTKPGSVETNSTLVVEVSNVNLQSI